MSAQLLVILVTCTGQSSAQAQDTVPRFQVETKSGVAAIAETLADLELKLGSSFLQADEAVIAQNLVLGGLEETIQSIIEAGMELNQTLNEIVKNRQAVSSTLQIIQFLMMLGWAVTMTVMAIAKCVRRSRAQMEEEQMEMIEKKLQERREQPRAKAKATPQ